MALYDLDNRIRAFGERRRLNVGTAANPRWIINVHAGDDHAETYGHDNVYAVQPGRVIFSGWSSTYGWHLRVRRDKRTVVSYHSLEAKSPLEAGDDVEPGDWIGLTGNSASGANGNHVHVQVEVDGTPVAPRSYIAPAVIGSGADGAPATDFDNTTEDDMFTDNDRKLLNDVADVLHDGGTDVAKGWSGNAGTVLRYAHDISAAVVRIEAAVQPAVVTRNRNSKATLLTDADLTHPKVQDDADTNSISRELLVRVLALQAAVEVLAVGSGIEPEKLTAMIAERVDAALQDDFDRIPAEVRTEIKEAL